MMTYWIIPLIYCFSAVAADPYYATYVNKVTVWWGEGVTDAIGATNSRGYNIVMLAFWIPGRGAVDSAVIWENPLDYGIPDFGETNEEIRENLRSEYHKQGAKVLLSAFGATSHPTTEGIDAAECGRDLAQYVVDMQYDGVDLDYEDSAAMEAGTAVPWLTTMTNAMLEVFDSNPGSQYMILHAPQAPYFMDGKYPQNYVDLDKALGDRIDAYLVQFYNQETTEYSTYQSLFVHSDGWADGTALQEIADKGVPKQKIVVGKPVTEDDVYNTGYVPISDLAETFSQARSSDGPWHSISDVGGAMGWQFSSDADGDWISQLKNAIGEN